MGGNGRNGNSSGAHRAQTGQQQCKCTNARCLHPANMPLNFIHSGFGLPVRKSRPSFERRPWGPCFRRPPMKLRSRPCSVPPKACWDVRRQVEAAGLPAKGRVTHSLSGKSLRRRVLAVWVQDNFRGLSVYYSAPAVFRPRNRLRLGAESNPVPDRMRFPIRFTPAAARRLQQPMPLETGR